MFFSKMQYKDIFDKVDNFRIKENERALWRYNRFFMKFRMITVQIVRFTWLLSKSSIIAVWINKHFLLHFHIENGSFEVCLCHLTGFNGRNSNYEENWNEKFLQRVKGLMKEMDSWKWRLNMNREYFKWNVLRSFKMHKNFIHEWWQSTSCKYRVWFLKTKWRL